MTRLRIISLLLIAAMAVSLAACSKTPHEVGEQTGGEAGFLSTEAEAETELTADVPSDANYDGYEFRVLHWFLTGWESRLDKDIYAAEEIGEVLNDAVYKRNLAVSERLNITISLEDMDYAKVPTTIRNMVSAGDDAYDLTYIRTYESPSLITDGCLNDFNDLPYVDLTREWWDQNCVEDLSIGGKLYLAASDINVIDKDATASIVFNKALAKDLNVPDLYYIVNDGKWTIDKIHEFSKTAASDVDGDGKMTLDDTWGMIGGADVPTAFFNGAGSTFAAKDEDDMPVYTFDSEYNYSVTDRIIEYMLDDSCFYNHHTGTGGAAKTDDNEYQKLFENGHGLFFWTRLDAVTSMRASETEFGILPTPKYQESQDKYYSLVSIHTAGLMSVPISATDLDRTSVILESWACESLKVVQPAYYEVALKGKYVRDEESSAMLDLIFGSRVFDIGIFYAFGGFTGAYESIQTQKAGAASLYASKQKAIEKDIQKLIDQVTNLGN